MKNRAIDISPRQRARIAGAFYLLTIIMGVFGEVFVRGALVVSDDASATAANIGGTSFLTHSFAVFLAPALAVRLPYAGMLGGIAELALCVWLMVMGIDALKWETTARAARHGEIDWPQ